MKALIDYDVITYQQGFASDKSFYISPDGIQYSSAKEAKQYWPRDQLTKVVHHEPWELCRLGVDEYISYILQETGATEYVGFITGKGNYRETIDSILPYKGNRPNIKPTWYEKIQEHLVKKHHGVVVDGMEADDAMGIEQWKDYSSTQSSINEGCDKDHSHCAETIICTTDKDLDMIPGWHYNFRKNKTYFVPEDVAIRWFYKQLIMGDKQTDNIQGIPGAGPAAARVIDLCETEEEMYETVREAYHASGQNDFDLLENATLLWIQREEGKYWNPPN